MRNRTGIDRIKNIYYGIICRCTKSIHPRYNRYGGRGIKVCNEWRISIQSFINWAIENGYSDNLSIDREDNNGHYEPSNCRWVDNVTQANNTGKKVLYSYNSESLTGSQWSKRLGGSPRLVQIRISNGWTVEQAVTTKSDRGRRRDNSTYKKK